MQHICFNADLCGVIARVEEISLFSDDFPALTFAFRLFFVIFPL